MVNTIKDMLVESTPRPRPLRMVELVGPAGAGKTTLSRALSQYSPKIVVGADIELRKKEQIPAFVRNAPFLVPVLLRRCQSSRPFTWDEIKAMVYLKGWHRVFRQQVINSGSLVVLDHGPVFKLATLQAFGPERLRTQAVQTWWNDMVKQWALTLDMVIWLDAPDAILEQRINARSQRHLVKGKSEPEVVQFLARYRASYEQTLTKLRSDEGPALLKFDTSQTSMEEITQKVLAACDIAAS
jgi:shikimate kinase